MFSGDQAHYYGSCLQQGKGARLCVGAIVANENSDAQARSLQAEVEETVTVRTILEKSGVEVRIKVPVASYEGVVIATHISDEGVLTSSIELVHPDTSLNYQLYTEQGNANCVAEWQNWGKRLQLPLLIKAGNGDLIPYSQKVDGVFLGASAGQARSRGHKTNRPHFLNRRQPGRPRPA